MDDPLGNLEGKVDQIIALCASLRTENHRLRGRVGELENETQGLSDRMAEARTRLESLMERLPAE